MRLLELFGVLFALAYLVLAVRQSLWCWPAALVSVVLSMVVFYDARLYMESVLQIFYFAMGIYGWAQWRRGGADQTGARVHWWPWPRHAVTIAVILLASAALGWALIRIRPDAAFPYLDSFTTVAAIVTTYMVARKVIENWIYWLVIDSLLVYLYLARGLYLYAGLFVLYLFLIVFGFRAWLASARAEGASAASAGSHDGVADGRAAP